MGSTNITSSNVRKALDAVKALRTGDLPKGLSINAAAGQDPELLIYDDIGPSWAGMVDGDSVIRALKQLPSNHKRVIVRLNSPGGDVFEGFAIYNALARHPAEVVIEVDALAASAASIIAMAGDKIRMAANSMMMIHRAWTIAWGNALELTDVVALLEKVDANLVETYVARTGQKAADVQGWLDAETWMTAAEAVERGFADEIGQELTAQASVPEGRFKNTPKRFLEALHPAERERLAPPADPVEPPPAPASAATAVRQRVAVARRRLGV